MDNFPPVVGSLDAIEVPYLPHQEPRVEYDCESFDGFPRRMGWDRAKLIDGDICQGHTEAECAAFLQSWLFFAFLMDLAPYFRWAQKRKSETGQDGPQEITLQKWLLKIGLLKRKDDGSLLVTLESLRIHVHRYRQSCSAQPPDSRQRARHFNETNLRKANFWISAMLGRRRTAAVDEILPAEIRLSIQNLARTIRFACTVLFANDLVQESSNLNERDHLRNVRVRDSSMVQARLRVAGWCPADINIFSSMWSARMLYYASLIPSWDSQDHTMCSLAECRHSIVDDQTYNTRHVTNSCACEVIDLTEKIQQFYENDTGDNISSAPLLCFVEDQVSSCHSKKLRVCSGQPYVAISHVWSDGLGNPNGNALPTCQIQKIQIHVDAVWLRHFPTDVPPTSIPFWMDTICVPLNKEYRKTAMTAMGDIYKQAEIVLALDRRLYEHELGSQYSMEEVMTRLATTKWFGRLWTLQEGLFASNLYVQFKNGTFNPVEAHRYTLGDATTSGEADPEHNLYRGIMIARGTYVEATGFSISPLSKYHGCSRLVGRSALWNMLQTRATSKAEDEITCLASLLNFSKNEKRRLLDVEGHEARMIAFLHSPELVEIPETVLYTNWPKFHIDGLRWAPVSFIRAATKDAAVRAFFIDNSTRNAKILAEGLLIQGVGFSLEKSILPFHCPFYAKARFSTAAIEAWLEIKDVRSSMDKMKEPWHSDIARYFALDRQKAASTSEQSPSTGLEPVLIFRERLAFGASQLGILGAASPRPATIADFTTYQGKPAPISIRYLAVVKVYCCHPSSFDGESSHIELGGTLTVTALNVMLEEEEAFQACGAKKPCGCGRRHMCGRIPGGGMVVRLTTRASPYDGQTWAEWVVGEYGMQLTVTVESSSAAAPDSLPTASPLSPPMLEGAEGEA